MASNPKRNQKSVSISKSQFTAYEFFGPLSCAVFSSVVPEATNFVIEHKLVMLAPCIAPFIYQRFIRPSGYFPLKRAVSLCLVNVVLILVAVLFTSFNLRFELKESGDYDKILESGIQSYTVAIIAFSTFSLAMLDNMRTVIPIIQLVTSARKVNSVFASTLLTFFCMLFLLPLVLPTAVLPVSVLSSLRPFQVAICMPLIALSLTLPVSTTKWASFMFILGATIEIPLCMWSGIQMGLMFTFSGVAASAGALLMGLSATIALCVDE